MAAASTSGMAGFALFMLAVLYSTSAFAAPLSLKEALRYAVEHNPELEGSVHEEAIGELNVSKARAAFLPSLDLTSIHGIDKRHPANPTDPWSSSVNLALTENLYDNGQSITQYRISKLARDIAQVQRGQAREALARDVARKFYTFSLQGKLVGVRASQLEAYSKQFHLVEGQYKQGLKIKRDFLRFKAQAQRAEIDHRDALISRDRAVTDLRGTLGVPPGEPSPELLPVDPEIDAKSLPREAPPVDGTFEYRIAKLKRDVTPEQTDLARRLYWPQIGLTASAGYANSSYLHSPFPSSAFQNYGWNVLLTVSYNFWDWGLRKNNVQIAERQELIEDTRLRRTSLDAATEIRNVMLDLDQLRETYLLTKELKKSSEDVFEVLRREYHEGTVQSVDLVQGLSDLLDAQVRYYTAHYGLADGLARYYYFGGKIYEKLMAD